MPRKSNEFAKLIYFLEFIKATEAALRIFYQPASPTSGTSIRIPQLRDKARTPPKYPPRDCLKIQTLSQKGI